MHHSSFSAASSSSGQPDKPATAPTSTSHSSAEQPATPSHLKISSIHDVQRWMAEEPIASYSSADAQRLREAVAVLSNPKPRKEDVRPLQSKWQVAQQVDRNPRPLRDVIQEFQTKVIDAAKKLQLELSDSAAQPGLSAVEQFAHSAMDPFMSSDESCSSSSAERPAPSLRSAKELRAKEVRAKS